MVVKQSVLRFFLFSFFFVSSFSATAAEQKFLMLDNPPFSISKITNHPIIAVLDSGVDYNHKDLVQNIWTNPHPSSKGDLHGWDFVDDDAHPYDYVPYNWLSGTIFSYQTSLKSMGFLFQLIRAGVAGHGTHVAGIALKASGGAAAIMPLRVNTDDPNAIVRAVMYAAKHHVRIVNMSFGSYENHLSEKNRKGFQNLKQVMQAHPEMLFVLASGNENIDSFHEKKALMPAEFRLPNMIVVGAIDEDGRLAPFSNVGEGYVDVYAPGVEVLSTYPGNKEAKYSGTSMAAPYVAGLTATILKSNPRYSVAKIKDALLEMSAATRMIFTTREGAQYYIQGRILR